jgi:glycolate oxidase FAD binding subunit
MVPPDAQTVLNDARARWGDAAVHSPRPDESVGASVPLMVLEPPDTATIAQMMGWADDRRLAVVARGGGTKRAWGVLPTRADAILSLAQLKAPVEHCAGDLTATVPAGVTLEVVNRELARAGQWLPLDPLAGGRCSIGGLLATNDSGPRRLRYGAPRDQVIGIEMVLPGGRVAKAGGRVVKNVAGYDLARLLTGSYGSLAIITSATFKLAPLPAASCTVVARAAGPHELSLLAQAIAAAHVTPSAVEIDNPSPRLLVRFESTASASNQQADQILDLCAQHGATATTLSGALEADAWSAYAAESDEVNDALLKVTVLPTALEDLLACVSREARDRSLAWRVFGRATLGVLFCRLGGPPLQIVSFVLKLREAVGPRFGRVAVLAADPAVKATVPPWGEAGGVSGIMRAVKAQFDPHGTLCPGGGPGGVA